MDGVSFSFFFNKNFLYLLRVPLVGLWGLVWGFGVGCGGLIGGEVVGVACRMHPLRVWSHGLFSGWLHLAGSSLWSSIWAECRFGAWHWIGLSGPGEGLGASLIISLMLCNYIKFQNCK